MELQLCGNDHCPKVITTKTGVEIGEKGNLVKLKPEEWNTLVDAIKNRKLNKV